MDEDKSKIIHFKEKIKKLRIPYNLNTLPEKVDATAINFIVEIK